MVDCSLIKAEHIKEALAYIDENGTPQNRKSRTRFVEYNGKRYAPKYVFAVAYTIAKGIDKAKAESIMDYTTFQILPKLKEFAKDIMYSLILEKGTGTTWDVNTTNREKAFMDWLQNIAVKENGEKYKENAIGAFKAALRALSKELNTHGLGEVFDMLETDEVDNIIKVFAEDSALNAAVMAKGHGSNVTLGLRLYKRFLLFEAGELSGLRENEVEAIFRKWLSSQSSNIKITTLNGYCAALKKDWSKTSVADIKPSPFDYATVGDFEAAAKQVKSTDGDFVQGVVWYKKFLQEYGNGGGMSATEELVKFKKLLNWFVTQLKINNEIIEGKVTAGLGYKGQAIRKAYAEWRSYNGFDLDCAIQAGYQKASTINYVHLTNSWLNIVPKFKKIGDKSDVYALQIVLKKEGNQVVKEYPEITLDELDLLTDGTPNEELGKFFDTFKEEVKKYLATQQGSAISGDESEIVLKGKNIIFYGVPGSGKSYSISGRINEIVGSGDAYDKLEARGNISRVVFHPDYTYTDFTGQILPTTDDKGQVKYVFKAGPFTNILIQAEARPKEPFFLIIEEINRGNAAAIFGDIFQSLDRDGSGESEYPITNPEIALKVRGDKDAQIVVPKNLWLFATMNTSDQNVFTLDTAFQRRWDMELVPNVFSDDSHNFIIEGTGITWKTFAQAVNAILAGQDGVMSSEDKSLGAWFIRPDLEDEDAVSRKRFANKVLKYLWDDAFKFDRKAFFNTDKYKTLEQVIAKFKTLKTENGFGDLSVLPILISKDETAEGETENN